MGRSCEAENPTEENGFFDGIFLFQSGFVTVLSLLVCYTGGVKAWRVCGCRKT